MRGRDFLNLKEQERQDPSAENPALEGHLQEKAEQPHRVIGIYFFFSLVYIFLFSCFILFYFVLFCLVCLLVI